MENNKEVLLKFFKSAIEAELFQGILKAEGIPSIVRRQGMEMRIGYPDYDGAEIFVSANSLEKAKEVLKAYAEKSVDE